MSAPPKQQVARDDPGKSKSGGDRAERRVQHGVVHAAETVCVADDSIRAAELDQVLSHGAREELQQDTRWWGEGVELGQRDTRSGMHQGAV